MTEESQCVLVYCSFYRWLTDNDEVLDFWCSLREFAERVFLIPAPPPGLLSLVNIIIIFYLKKCNIYPSLRT